MGNGAQTLAVVFHDFLLGGSERIAIRLMNRWAELGRSVIVLCGERRGPLAPMISQKVRVVECTPPIPRAFGSRRRLAQALALFVTQHRPDVLFIPGNFHWPLLVPIAALPTDICPTVVTQISTPIVRPGRGPLTQFVYTRLTRYRLRCLDAAIALSTSTVADADRVLGRPITEYIKLPVLDDASGGEQPAPASGNTIVTAGRLVKEKGVDVALRAFALIKDTTAKLVILGEGYKQAELLSLAKTLGVSGRVEFVGYVPDIRPWLDRARVFLLSSFYEGYSAVLVEALAAGRPVVSTDCTPAVADLLQTTQGCAITPIGDPVALAAALDRVLVSVPPDPQVLARTVADYRIGPIAKSYLDVFDRVHSRKRKLGSAALPKFSEDLTYI